MGKDETRWFRWNSAAPCRSAPISYPRLDCCVPVKSLARPLDTFAKYSTAGGEVVVCQHAPRATDRTHRLKRFLTDRGPSARVLPLAAQHYTSGGSPTHSSLSSLGVFVAQQVATCDAFSQPLDGATRRQASLETVEFELGFRQPIRDIVRPAFLGHDRLDHLIIDKFLWPSPGEGIARRVEIRWERRRQAYRIGCATPGDDGRVHGGCWVCRLSRLMRAKAFNSARCEGSIRSYWLVCRRSWNSKELDSKLLRRRIHEERLRGIATRGGA